MSGAERAAVASGGNGIWPPCKSRQACASIHLKQPRDRATAFDSCTIMHTKSVDRSSTVPEKLANETHEHENSPGGDSVLSTANIVHPKEGPKNRP